MGRRPSKQSSKSLQKKTTAPLEAYNRLVAGLEKLRHLTGQASVSPGKQPIRFRRDAAVHAMRWHARATIDDFAFIDGLRVAFAHPGLLTVFYADPMSRVASRYCWALLAVGQSVPPTLDEIIEATQLEHQQFAKRQDEIFDIGEETKELSDLILEEDDLLKGADRLGYTTSVLRRSLLYARHMASSDHVSEIERELSQLDEVAAAVFEDLRTVQLLRLRAKRSET